MPRKKTTRKKVTRKKTTRKKPTKKKVVRQTGKSVTRIDKKLRAKKPGRRVSKSGNVYFERRRNRSDKNPKKKL